MTNSEIREIRKRIDEGLSNFKTVYGCFVNAAGEIVSEMEIPVLDMDSEEREMYSKLLKKVISGPAGRHLLDVNFSTKQVELSDEHRLLMGLRDKHLEDAGLRSALYDQIIGNFENDGKSYVILLAADTYDIKPRDDDEDEWSEESESQFEYFICAVCGVRDPKAALRYQAKPKAFRGSSTGSILTSPMVGFMFPSFTDRQADIYIAPYYTKKTDDIHEELIAGLFRVEDVPSAASTQKEKLGDALYTALGSDCNLDIMTSLQARLSEQVVDEDGSAAGDIPFSEIEKVLSDKGIPEDKLNAFREKIDAYFPGKDSISASTIIEKKKYKLTSSAAEITVDPQQAVRLKTKKIDGITYFLVPVGSDARVNGLDICTETND